MISRILLAVLNGIITFVVLSLLVYVLTMVGLTAASIISPFIMAISVIIGLLTFFGKVPNYFIS